MNAQKLKKIEEIFLAAIEISPAEREAFFKETCGTDEDLRREVDSLIAFENTPGILDGSLEELAAEMFADVENKASLIDKEIGRYKIKKILGKGGMGEVYLAEDTKLNRLVALKFLSLTTWNDRNNLRRFKQEAFAASALNHPNILTIYEFNSEGDICFLATEYIEGKTLREMLGHSALKVKDALNIAEQIALALASAHKANIVHRDIKPENIMLREDGFVKVLDFGLAKLTSRQELTGEVESRAEKIVLTKTGAIMGTTSYMSPEQIRGKTDIDARSDIWSLGIVLFEMLTGSVPFAGETNGDTIASILKNDPPSLSDYIVDCPPGLPPMIHKTLAKNVEDRYEQIRDFALDIKSLKTRLEFEDELKRSHAANGAEKTLRGIKEEYKETQKVSARMTVDTALSNSANEQETSHPIGVNKNQSLILKATVTLILLVGLVGGFFVWRSIESNAAVQQNLTNASIAPSNKSSLRLNYSLTAQSYNNGQYKNPFKLSGEMLFRNKDRVRLNIISQQDGFLYILNQSPKDETAKSTFNILFPSPTANDGASRLSANQEIQIPRQSWFELDDKEGTELIWLVWSASAISELESARRFANPEDRGKIKDETLSKFIESLLQNHQSNKGNIERDDDRKVSQITSNADILAHVIKLEHH